MLIANINLEAQLENHILNMKLVDILRSEAYQFLP